MTPTIFQEVLLSPK